MLNIRCDDGVLPRAMVSVTSLFILNVNEALQHWYNTWSKLEIKRQEHNVYITYSSVFIIGFE